MKPQRRFVLKTLAAAIACIGMGRAQGADTTPGVHSIKGQVLVNGVPATLAQPLTAGSTVETGADGEAVYVIGDNAFLQRAGSQVQFPRAAPPGHAGSASTFLRVISGRILSVFGKGNKDIETPAATIGIRGTACYIEVTSEHNYFCLCYGSARITPREAPERAFNLNTTHHDSPLRLSPSGNVAVPAQLMNHTDEELAMLESLTGRTPPFYRRSGYGEY